jgi:PleD family two-component response regulator
MLSAELPDNEVQRQQALQRADQPLYRAKRSGRNRGELAATDP